MYAALSNEKLVLAMQEAQKWPKISHDYRCPHCHKAVMLVLSETKAAFFRHVSQNTNLYGEKEEHHLLKMQLTAALIALGYPARPEVPLANGEIRADVLANEKLAFEIQCAPLDDEEYRRRHQSYQSIHVQDIWIVGHRHFLGKKFKASQIKYFRTNRQWGDYYLEGHLQEQVLYLKYNVQLEPLRNRTRYCLAKFSLDEKGIERLWQFKPRLYAYRANIAVQKSYLREQIKRKTQWGLAIAQFLYEHRQTVDDLPDAVFTKWRRPYSRRSLRSEYFDE
ncbi:MAG: competence protein CoiA family protein [Lactobacillus sp.]|nr:competence protein CoiA family protein [Lactobacillus sp.]